jgi:hypothetical protein
MTVSRPSWSRFWLRWVLANLVAELLGLGAAAGAGVLLASELGQPGDWGATISFAVVMVLFGTFEGVLVGIGQRWAMQGAFDELPWGYWIAATGTGAFLAWILGMVPSTWMSLAADLSVAANVAPKGLAEISDAMQLLLAVPLGAVAGLILAFPQFLVLRRYVERAWRWLPANALAWALGMPLIFLGAAGAAPGVPGETVILRAVVAVVGAGVVVGGVHGWALIRMVAGLTPAAAPAPPPEPPSAPETTEPA